MSMIEVTAQPADGSRSLSVNYDFGDNLDEAVQKFGADVVFTKFRASAIIDLQGRIRSGLKRTGEKVMTDEQIVASLANWKPTIATLGAGSRKVTVEGLLEKAAKMTDEDRRTLLEQLKAKLGG